MLDQLNNSIFLFLIFWGLSILFHIVATPICYPTSSTWGFPFLYILTTLVTFSIFDNIHSDRCEVIYHYCFDFHISDDYWWWSFCVPIGHLYAFFGKMSIQVLSPFFNHIFCCCFSNDWYMWSICILWMLSPYQIYDYKYLLPFSRFPFNFCWWFLWLVHKLFSFMQPHIFIFVLLSLLVKSDLKRNISKTGVKDYFVCFILEVLLFQVLYSDL